MAWLNDAYAMEKALVAVLQRHAKDAEEDATVQARIVRHRDDTQQQAEIVKSCIEELGGSVSTSMSAIASLFGAGQGMLNRPMRDTMVKNSIADYATEHFEIASYLALIIAAEELGETSVAAKLRGILDQELEMARFLEDHLAGACGTTSWARRPEPADVGASGRTDRRQPTRTPSTALNVRPI